MGTYGILCITANVRQQNNVVMPRNLIQIRRNAQCQIVFVEYEPVRILNDGDLFYGFSGATALIRQ